MVKKLFAGSFISLAAFIASGFVFAYTEHINHWSSDAWATTLIAMFVISACLCSVFVVSLLENNDEKN